MIKTAVQTGVLGSGDVKTQSGILIAKNIYNKYSDLDAKNFLWAAGVVGVPDKEAIYYLCRELKMADIYSKISILYPFVGCDYTSPGSSLVSNSYRFNLINPSQFLCTVNGGATYSRNSYRGNGTSGFLDTGFAPNRLNKDDTHICVYSRTAGLETAAATEFSTGAVTTFTLIRVRNSAGNFQGNINSATLQIANPDGRGLYVMQRTSSTTQFAYKNGSFFGSGATASAASALASTLYIANSNTSPFSFWSSREIAFVTAGRGLTAQENRDYYTIVQNFQTIMGRAV